MEGPHRIDPQKIAKGFVVSDSDIVYTGSGQERIYALIDSLLDRLVEKYHGSVQSPILSRLISNGDDGGNGLSGMEIARDVYEISPGFYITRRSGTQNISDPDADHHYWEYIPRFNGGDTRPFVDFVNGVREIVS